MLVPYALRARLKTASCPAPKRELSLWKLFVLTALVPYGTACLASRLAGGLALAAAALFGALAEAAGLQGLDSLHDRYSHLIEFKALRFWKKRPFISDSLA